DVLFESAADVYGPAVIGVVLTGTSKDGSAGLAKIKERGGTTIVQDPSTALRRTMPDAALAGTTVDWTLPIEQIGRRLTLLCAAPQASAPPASASQEAALLASPADASRRI